MSNKKPASPLVFEKEEVYVESFIERRPVRQSH